MAAYARVSSDSEDQLNSLAVQVDYYTHLIQENPNWEFAGIYTDEGITGTSTKRREQFNRLMDDCRAGLIDRVLVKSASRFARNTADALSSVRELKSLGVTVAFEKEGFDTETSNGEMLLSIICAVAQEESLSISQNMKWGIHKRMRTGNYITNATPFGYTQINHQLVPEKNNAMIVNDIFKSYLSGMSINADLWDRIQKREPNAYLVLLYWDSEMFRRSTKKRRDLEAGTEKKDYKALCKDILFLHPEKYTIAKDTKAHLDMWRGMFIKTYGIAMDKHYKTMYEGLLYGDPKMRVLRILWTEIYNDHNMMIKEAQRGKQQH